MFLSGELTIFQSAWLGGSATPSAVKTKGLSVSTLCSGTQSKSRSARSATIYELSPGSQL